MAAAGPGPWPGRATLRRDRWCDSDGFGLGLGDQEPLPARRGVETEPHPPPASARFSVPPRRRRRNSLCRAHLQQESERGPTGVGVWPRQHAAASALPSVLPGFERWALTGASESTVFNCLFFQCPSLFMVLLGSVFLPALSAGRWQGLQAAAGHGQGDGRRRKRDGAHSVAKLCQLANPCPSRLDSCSTAGSDQLPAGQGSVGISQARGQDSEDAVCSFPLAKKLHPAFTGSVSFLHCSLVCMLRFFRNPHV